MSGASSADAFVVYSGIEDLEIGSGNTQILRLDGDGNDDIQLSNRVDPYVGLFGNFQGAFLPFAPGALVGFSASGINYVKALSAGYFVDQSKIGPFVGSMAFGTNHPNAQFNNSTDAYLGFGFPITDENGTANHFGWIRVTINNAAGTFTINDWAYESEPAVGIVTGDMGSAGDFNDDGTVDAADYTVYRDNLGSNNTLGGHGDENFPSVGIVDIHDYTLWRANFGHVDTPATASSAVPEPLSLGLLAAGAGGLRVARRMRGQK